MIPILKICYHMFRPTWPSSGGKLLYVADCCASDVLAELLALSAGGPTPQTCAAIPMPCECVVAGGIFSGNEGTRWV
jgi:hypothetical protein